MPPVKDQFTNVPRSSVGVGALPGCILAIRGVSMGRMQGLQIFRFTGGDLTDVKSPTWLSGQLGAMTVAEIEATVIDQFRLGLLAHYGVQADLFEGLIP